MTMCSRCGSQDITTELEPSPDGPLCPSCASERMAAWALPWWRRIHPLALLGLLAAAVPLAFSVTITRSVERDGVTYEHVSEAPLTDHIALGCGALAALLGLILIPLARRRGRWRRGRLLLALGVLALGLYHVGRALGVLPELPIPGL